MGYIPRESERRQPAWLPGGHEDQADAPDIAQIVDSNAPNLKRFAEIFGN